MRSSVLFRAIPLALAFAPGLLLAQEPVNHLYDKFQIQGSIADVVLGTTLNIGTSIRPGTDVTFADLGIGRSEIQPRLALRWRPWRRHEFEVGYQWIGRTGGRTLSDSIRFADTTFYGGATINTKYDSDNLFLGYRLSILAKPKTQVGVQLSLGAILFKFGIDALASGAGSSVQYSQSKDFTGPFGALGAFGNFAFGERWNLLTNPAAIYGNASNIKVTEYTIGAAGRYFLSKRLGFELGYGVTGMNVEITGSSSLIDTDIVGKINWNYQNIRAGVIVAFQ